MAFFNTAVPNRFAAENSFPALTADRPPLPVFSESRKALPHPHWEGHEDTIDCYWKAWELAFGNLRQPPQGSPLVANFIDTAFNNATFMWDSAFMSMFGRYGHRVFNFQRTLDNFYARQHKDGFICREIVVADGSEAFERTDVSSTGPNILPWAEWEYYLNFGDKERLARVFPPLVAYTQWFRKFRSWPDGSYFSSGWGCGMDNQPRVPAGCSPEFDHGHLSWIDTTLQQILADRVLVRMAGELGRTAEVADLQEEAETLSRFVNTAFWNEKEAFYFDRRRDGTLSDVKTIGAYWAMLAGTLSGERREAFTGHLEDPAMFNRPHRVPTLSADHPGYDAVTGHYWLGGVWAPTNYMVLRGLTSLGKHALAHEIAMNHLRNVTGVFKQTGTLWENYSPEFMTQGSPARADFVGWTGLSPIAILLEYGFGLQPDAAHDALTWDIRLAEAHGVDNYPLGPGTLLNLGCGKRANGKEKPVIAATASRPATVIVKWEGGEETLRIPAS